MPNHLFGSGAGVSGYVGGGSSSNSLAHQSARQEDDDVGIKIKLSELSKFRDEVEAAIKVLCHDTVESAAERPQASRHRLHQVGSTSYPGRGWHPLRQSHCRRTTAAAHTRTRRSRADQLTVRAHATLAG